MPLPARIAAIPDYVGRSFPNALRDAAPGHRFAMYFRYWQGGGAEPYARYKDARASGRTKEEQKQEKDDLKVETKTAVAEVCPLGESAQATVKALRGRQRALLSTLGERAWTCMAKSTAPFATGLGNEHPLDNGFAFLTPYGLPYLAGSGVKGVLRRAAEELAGDSFSVGWTWLDVWWLFGFEGAETSRGPVSWLFADDAPGLLPLAQRNDLRDFIGLVVTDKEDRKRYVDDVADRRPAFLERLRTDSTFRQSIHYRGAIDFWDVFPAPKDGRLAVEIMTPHYADYYQKEDTPHDAGAPTPVPFLAVPADSDFTFHAVCHDSRLPEPVRARWHDLLGAASAHAFDWLGFGAKTSVGYGAMGEPVAATASAAVGAGTSKPTSSAAPVRTTELWDGVRLEWIPNSSELRASRGTDRIVPVKKEKAQQCFADPAVFERLLKKKEIKGQRIEIERQGNQATLLRVLAADSPLPPTVAK